MRRKLREEKRKAKILQKLEITGADEINEKIAIEEKKLLKVQRKLEAIRLVEELFRRIKEKNPGNIQLYEGLPNPGHEELKRFKNTSELEVLTQREKLHHALKGRVMLKTILSDKGKPRRNSSSSSDSSLSLEENLPKGRPRSPVLEKYPELMYDPNWLGYHYQFPGMYPELMDPFSMRGYMPRGRAPFPRLPMLPGPSRGMNYGGRRRPMRSRRGYRGGGRGRQFNQELTEEYEKYFNQFLNQHNSREDRSYSRDRSRDRMRFIDQGADRGIGQGTDQGHVLVGGIADHILDLEVNQEVGSQEVVVIGRRDLEAHLEEEVEGRIAVTDPDLDLARGLPDENTETSLNPDLDVNPDQEVDLRKMRNENLRVKKGLNLWIAPSS
nr:unnamed protein product [Callosobruchus chinensis]